MGNSKENLHTDLRWQSTSVRRISSRRYCLIQHHISQGLDYKKRKTEIIKMVFCQGRLKIKTLVT